MDTPTLPLPRQRSVIETTLPSSSTMKRTGTKGREILENLPTETKARIKREVKKVIQRVRRKYPSMGMSSYQAWALREECRREVESLLCEWSAGYDAGN